VLGRNVRAPLDVPRVRDYVTMLARGWAIILVATVLSAGAALCAQQLTRTPAYTASVQLFAVVTGDPGVHSAAYGGMGSTARMDTYVQLAKSTMVMQRTIDDVGLDVSAPELAANVGASATPGVISPLGRPMSALLRVQVTGSDPDTTVMTANALAANLIALSQELEWTESELGDEIQFTGPAAELVPIDPASAAQEVPAPLARSAALGAGLGLALSSVLVLASAISREPMLNKGHVKHVVTQAVSEQERRSML
jgi:capsular polysaccharide biosynthesis protein